MVAIVRGGLRLHRVLSLLAVLAVLGLWTAEAVWHEHADHADHHDCPVCQIAQHHGAAFVAPVVVSTFAPVCVSGLPASDTDLDIDEPCVPGPSPRGPPTFSLS